MASPETKRRRSRRVSQLGWLVFLGFQLLGFFAVPRTLPDWLLFWAVLVAFVALYVANYWREDGDERVDTAWALAGFGGTLVAAALLGLVVGGISAGLLIYGAFMVGYQPRLRLALSLVLGGYILPLLGAAALLSGQWWDQPWGAAVPLGTLTLSAYLLFGAYSSNQEWRGRRAMAALRAAQAEKERLAADAERERIARDLHDLLGHTLSVIVLKSELAGKLAEKEPARAAGEIREVERISREALKEVRAAVQGYRGSGFAAELARAKVALDTAGVRLDVSESVRELAPEVEAAAAMLLREAVTNIVRHAQARQVTVEFSESGSQRTLVIADDGVGGQAPEGTGLSSMRERLRAIGGTLERDGRQGTRLTAHFPVSNSTANSTRPSAPSAHTEVLA